MLLDPVLSMLSPFWALTNTVARKFTTQTKLSKPVISVGNIVAGGVGKTELVFAISSHLAKHGKNVVVASRGYGSEWMKIGGIAKNFEEAQAHHFPDEAMLLLKKMSAQGLSGKFSVAVGAKRVETLTRHWEELNPDVIVLDDGFQHFKLARDLDIIVHDFNSHWPILRDFPTTLKNIPACVSLSDIPKTAPKKNWIEARYKLTSSVDSTGKKRPLPKAAIAFCGIGNPIRFRNSLTQHGVEVKAFKTFSDHARYSESDTRKLLDLQQKLGLPLLTTLKDYVKLQLMSGFDPLWVEVELIFAKNEDLLWKAVDESVALRSS